MSDDIEKRLGSLEGDMKVSHAKLDYLTAAVDKLSSGIGQRVQDHGEQISSLTTENKNQDSYIEAVSKKIDRHIDSPGHWKFLVILATIFTLAGFAVKFFH